MKLIDLLVRELPKRGGWPEGKTHAWQDHNTEIRFSPTTDCDFFPSDKVLCEKYREIMVFDTSPDGGLSITRTEYQSALAASQKVEWSGDGLPPVGCECEVRESTFSSPFSEWSECKIAAINERPPRQTQVCVIDCNGDFAIFYSDKTNKVEFRPLRSEADKKRDDAVEDMVKIFSSNAATGTTAALVAIYDAIAAGKIPGVKLED